MCLIMGDIFEDGNGRLGGLDWTVGWEAWLMHLKWLSSSLIAIISR